MPATPTSPDNRVTLNGVDYAVRGPVRQQPASEFQAGLRIGSPQYDSREGAFILTLEDTSGGLGILSADERKSEHLRPRYSTIETRFPKAMMLGPLVTSVALAGVSFPSGIPQAKIVQWKDVLILGVGNKIFKMNGALTVSDITPATFATDVGANGEHSDLLVHDFNDGFFANAPAILWGLKNTGAGGATRQYYIAAAADPVAASWSAQGDLTPGEELNSMVSFDQKVMKIQGTVMKESNEGTTDTWGDLAVIPFTGGTFMTLPKYSQFLGTHRVPFGPDFMPWLLLNGEGGYSGKIAPLDYWARQFKPLELNIGRISAGFVMDEGIVISNTYDIWKIIPSDPPTLRPMGLRRQQGLSPEFASAVVSGLGSSQGDLVCGMTNLKGSGSGRVWILRNNGAGWHVIAEQATDNGIVLAIGVYERPASLYGWRSNQYLCWITWDGATAKLHYTQEPIGGGSSEQDPTYQYTASGVYETPWLYGGFEDLYGALLRIRVRGRLTATETVAVSYRLDEDDTSAWTALGTFDGATSELSWGLSGKGITFKSVRFKFAFVRGGSATNTPLVRAFVILYDKKPVTRRSYNFSVDVSRMIVEQANPDAANGTWAFFTAGLDFRLVLDQLVIAKDSYPLVAFTYDNEPTRYVKIIALPSSEEEIHDAMRRGVIQVQVAELFGQTPAGYGLD